MELEVTQHALERFEERVTTKYSNKTTFYQKVKEWCENSVKNGKFLGVDHNGFEIHRSSNFVLIIKGGNVITIKPAENETKAYYEVENTVKQTVKTSIKRMLRPLIEKQHELLIEINTNELKRVRVHHPDTKKSITIKIEGLQEELDAVRRDITFHRSVAHKYDIKIGEWL